MLQYLLCIYLEDRSDSLLLVLTNVTFTSMIDYIQYSCPTVRAKMPKPSIVREGYMRSIVII